MEFKNVQFQQEIKNLKEQLSILNLKEKRRNTAIIQLTRGYLKDIQHLKEMLHRSDYYKEDDYFEVEYIDACILADDDIRAIVNNKLETLKEQYKRKARNLMKKLKNL